LDKQILIEYADMKEEIKDLRRRIREDEKKLEKLNHLVVVDSVTCGKKGKKPIRTIKVEGRPTMDISRIQKTLAKKRNQMDTFELELLELQIRAEEFIETMQKSELRMMFRFYFLDGLSYPKVAKRMNASNPDKDIAYTDENVKKRIQRFFKNVPQCPD